jgi:hypothetical protein
MREGVGAIRGPVDESALADFPALALWTLRLGPAARKSSRAQKARLADLDDRFRTVPVGGLRTDIVASAYRAFARQIGLDPDVERNPLEQAARDRLTAGRYVSRGALHDGMLLAMLETSVPLWALAADAVHGWLRIAVDDRDTLVLADDRGVLAPVMSPVPEPLRPSRDAVALVYCLGVGQVPDATVEEAFWHVRSFVTGEG